jgi:hypothetical protein
VRVTRPGGTAVLSVSGEHAFAEFTRALRESGADPAKFIRQFRARGIVFVEDDYSIGEPFPDFYHSTFHGPWCVFEHWGRFFDIEAFVPRGALAFQDYVLLRRREGPSPIRPPKPRRVGEAVARSADEVPARGQEALPEMEGAARPLRSNVQPRDDQRTGRTRRSSSAKSRTSVTWLGSGSFLPVGVSTAKRSPSG